jgi:hypothetical protein
MWRPIFIIALYVIYSIMARPYIYVQKSAEDILRNPPNGFTIVRQR